MDASKSKVGAVKAFLEAGENGRPVSVGELREFWSKLTDAEKDEYAGSAAKALGVKLDETPVAKAA